MKGNGERPEARRYGIARKLAEAVSFVLRV